MDMWVHETRSYISSGEVATHRGIPGVSADRCHGCNSSAFYNDVGEIDFPCQNVQQLRIGQNNIGRGLSPLDLNDRDTCLTIHHRLSQYSFINILILLACKECIFAATLSETVSLGLR